MSTRRKRVGRPPKTDRGSVRAELVTLKLTRAEHATLIELVSMHERELSKRAHGARVSATVSSYLRDLIARDAEEKGISAS